jgi:hypothetical protein
MKKFLLTIAVAMTTMFATAQTKTYTDELVVTINNIASDPMQTTINVGPEDDGTYTLSLLNFIMGSGEDKIPVGNIVVPGISYETINGIDNFASKQTVPLTAGDSEVSSEWLADMLTEIPIDLNGKMTDGSLYCTINIDLTDILGQIIGVKFGKDIKATRSYEDDIVVTINEKTSAPQRTTINLDEKIDGTYTLSLNNFQLTDGEDLIPVGNIVLHNITTEEVNGVQNFAVKQDIVITDGSIEADWLGSMLGNVPVDLTGKMTEYKLYCNIDIDMTATLAQIINVKFGNESLTGIANIGAENAENKIFDITGRRISTIAAPGMYIINGKKVIIK